MKARDRFGLGWSALGEHRQRTALAMTGIAVAVAAVILLVSVGEGARGYVLEAFGQFGTNLLSVTPGKTETLGIPGAMGGTSHALTLADAVAVARLPGVRIVVPTVMGPGRVEGNGRARSVLLLGTTAEARAVWRVELARGAFLPHGDPRRGANVVVLGARLARGLYGDESPLGAWTRVGGRRMRVAGVMQPRGELLGFDMDDLAYVPVASALALFDLEGLSEIDVTFPHESMGAAVAADIEALLRERHGGQEDVTVVTQTTALAVLDRVMRGVTWAVVAIAAVSLVVGAIGILTTLWIAVGQRTHEIGLLRALGATLGEVQALFLEEAVLLASSGGAVGLAAGWLLTQVLARLVPALPVETPLAYVGLALGVSVVTGLVAGVAPARRAARLDPVEALRAE